MMDIFILHNIYRSKCLIVINGHMYVYKYEKRNFDQPFLSFQAKHIFLGESKVCELTKFSAANDSTCFDGNTVLLHREDNEYV